MQLVVSESCSKGSHSFGRTRSKETSRAPVKVSLLARAQKNFPVAGFENEHLAAVAYSPAFDARRRSYILCNRETFIADFIRSVGFNRETRAGWDAQRDCAVAGSRGYCVEISIQSD